MIPDFSPALRTLHLMALDAIARIPYFVVSLLVLGVFTFAARRMRGVLHRGAERAGRGANFSALVSRLGSGALWVGGALVAATIAFPSFTPATLVSVLGFGGVAAGFALREVLGNWLCGLVILASEPFRIGDRIIVRTFEGQVEDVQTRATTIRTRDGRRVVVPNTVVFSEPIEVVSAFGRRRMEVTVPLSGAADWSSVKPRLMTSLADLSGIEAAPPPDVFLAEIRDTGPVAGVRWWIAHDSDAAESASRDAVLLAVSRALRTD